jgi:alpha-glucosidase
VREAIKSAMRFWLDMGVDGFRVDAVRFMGKDPLFKNNPPNPDYKPGEWSKYGSIRHIYSQGRPQLYAYLAEMAAVLKEKQYAKARRALWLPNLTRKLKIMYANIWPFTKEWTLKLPRRLILKAWACHGRQNLGLNFLDKFHKALDDFSPLCVASYAFGNHDQHRLATRLGDLPPEAPQYCC